MAIHAQVSRFAESWSGRAVIALMLRLHYRSQGMVYRSGRGKPSMARAAERTLVALPSMSVQARTSLSS